MTVRTQRLQVEETGSAAEGVGVARGVEVAMASVDKGFVVVTIDFGVGVVVGVSSLPPIRVGVSDVDLAWAT